MDWNDVDAFCCVIEYGGFTAAAKALARPKSSISASVSRLETQLGARLLQRTTRRIRATEAGESLYQDAAPMFQRLREVRSSAAARGNTVAGTLRVAAPYEFGAHHLGAVACTMLARYRAARRLDRRAGIAFTHGLTQLFASDAPAVRIPRGLGMMLLDSVPAAKRAFTRAMLYGPRW